MSKAEQNRLCVGVDLHKHQFTVNALDDSTGEILLMGEFKTENEGYAEFISKMHEFENESGYYIELAVEATSNARFFKNKMEAEGFQVLVVNTSKFKVITMSTKKNDANDAATLAFYLSKEMLPESHLCDQTSEEIRRLLKTRSVLVSATVKIKNQIHGMMLGYGIETKSAQLQSKKKRQELYQDLADHDFSEFTAQSLEVTLSILDDLHEQIKKIEEQLHGMLDEDKTVEILMTMPGIGFINAATIASYTKDIERFDGDLKKFSAYLGLVPSVHNSGDTVHLGHITKHGPQELRTTFVQVAMGIIRQPQNTADWKLMHDYYCMKVEKGSGRAIIALTRKTARIIFSMLNQNQAFDETKIKRIREKQQAVTA